MSTSEFANLQQETGEALLKAIKQAAPNANSRGLNSLEHLANAYKTTVEGMKTHWQPGSKNA